jgi:hypothetical protein
MRGAARRKRPWASCRRFKRNSPRYKKPPAVEPPAATALDVLPEPPLPGRGRRYGVETIQLFCQCVLDAACSLRGASAVLGLLENFAPRLAGAPAANTGQMWLLQVGLYEVQRLIMTSLAHLVPPKLRSKARYMNLEELVAWGESTLRYLDDPHPVANEPLDRAALAAKLGWLEEYRAALSEWGSAMQVVAETLTYIRRDGYHPQAADELGWQLGPARSAMAQRVATRLLEFVAAQGTAAQPGEHLPGSTECLESLIGKGKRLEGQHSQSGFTKMILGLAAAVVRPTAEYLQTAFATVKNRDVHAWCQDRLGISLAAKRHQALATSRGTETG